MIRVFARDTVVYVIPTLITRAIGLFLLPIYTRYLAPADYGVVEILTLLYTLLNLILPLEVSQAVARFSADIKKPDDKSRYLSTAFWFTAFVFLIFVVCAFSWPESLEAVLGIINSPQLLPLASLAMLANALLYLVLNQLRWNLQAAAYSWVSISFSITIAAVSIILIAVFHLGVLGFVWGQLTASLLALGAGLRLLWRPSPVRLQFDVDNFREMVAFSAPLVLSSIAIYATLYADRWMLSMLMGVDAVGVYSVAYRIASIVALLVTGYQLALTPLVYSHYKEPQTPANIRRIFQYFLFGALMMITLIGAFAKEVVAILAGLEFVGAAYVAPWVALSVVLANLYVFAPGLFLAKKTKQIALLNLLAAAANIGTAAFLIPLIGLFGAALAALFGSAVMAILFFLSSLRYYSIPYEWKRYLVAFVTLLLFLVVVQFVAHSLFSRSLLAVFCSVALAVILIDQDERQWIAKKIVSQRKIITNSR
jgi:O-antigen/teichoic acid export membrane protein